MFGSICGLVLEIRVVASPGRLAATAEASAPISRITAYNWDLRLAVYIYHLLWCEYGFKPFITWLNVEIRASRANRLIRLDRGELLPKLDDSQDSSLDTDASYVL